MLVLLHGDPYPQQQATSIREKPLSSLPTLADMKLLDMVCVRLYTGIHPSSGRRSHTHTYTERDKEREIIRNSEK